MHFNGQTACLILVQLAGCDAGPLSSIVWANFLASGWFVQLAHSCYLSKSVTFFPVTFFPNFPNTCILTCPLLLYFLLLFFLLAHCFFFSCHFIHTATQMNCYPFSCFFFSHLSTVTFFPVTFFPVTFFLTWNWNCYFLSCYLFSCYFLSVPPLTKWLPFHRRYIQMHFREWKVFYFD